MKLTLLFCCYITTITLSAQTKVYPVINNAGAVFEVPYESEKPDPTMEYKIVATMGGGSEKHNEVHYLLQHFARLYNVHIIYAATPVVLNNEAYRTKYNVDNPNLDVLNEIKEAGVKILVCAQSLALLRIGHQVISPRVLPALSRFTALTTYQLKGYAPVIF